VRGSRRYVERHLDELKRLDARVLNFETVAHPEITILTSDSNGTVKNSPEMVNSVIAAAERAGVPYKVKSAFIGVGGDAGPFSKAGLHAMTCYSHSRCHSSGWPSITRSGIRQIVLTIEPLLNVLKLTLEWVSNGGESEN
jgi:Zn-dependent M28 family amino/carboxypeptidase